MTAIATSQPPTAMQRPRYEGANIRTWIGFKHLMYIVEESLLLELRRQGAGPQALYHEHGLGVELLDCSVQLPALVEIDDELEAQVLPGRGPGRYDVRLLVRRGAQPALALRGRATVGLIREAGAPGAAPPPGPLAELVRDEVRAPGVGARDLALGGAGAQRALTAGGAFHWAWRARYFHCHFSDRVQHSAFVRALEEVVDRFLADRGMSIRTMLDERGWIPVVSRARIQLVAAVRMEEIVHTTFAVTDILRSSGFDARMDCYVERGGRLVHAATAQILHGYAVFGGDDAGALVELDADVVATLMGEGRGR